MANNYLKNYLSYLQDSGNYDMAESINLSASSFAEKTLKGFSFCDHIAGLLFGNVQAGKTSHMFGFMCAAANAGFPIFILLTTDTVALQQQTYTRVERDLGECGFCICDEADKQKFIDNALSKPTIIVLKKNHGVLLQWYNTLASSSFVVGNALFIVDDEADAASPNTKINRSAVSLIHSRLMNIRNASICSIYLQVTGTPQALLLQSSESDFRPAFTYYFEPGKNYLGGDFFFGPDNSCIRFIDERSDDSDNSLYDAIIHHLIVSAELSLSGEQVTNFLIHPGIKKSSHATMKKSVNETLTSINTTIKFTSTVNDFLKEFNRCHLKEYSSITFDDVMKEIEKLLTENRIKVLIMNGDSAVTETDYTYGSNIIIGGNILGRGVTFPKLQTIYYTRTAKKPQADTMWQHSRMFGYDRNREMMAVFITETLYQLFSHINAANNSIIYQVQHDLNKIQLFYPEGINPTRRNVIDLKMVNFISGGTNYYPSNPENKDIPFLDKLLKPFEQNDYYQVGAKMLLNILDQIIPSEDFNLTAFISVIRARLAETPTEQCILIVRRNREVTQGTGSLLSPNDRELGARFGDKTVLTLYQIEGEHGWKQTGIWVPNIKLPEFVNYYDVQ